MTEEKLNVLQRARDFVFNRQRAYRVTFDPHSVINQRVLSDLAKFCRANESTFHPDARAHAVAEGRREVWLRIQNHLKLDSEALFKIYHRGGG